MRWFTITCPRCRWDSGLVDESVMLGFMSRSSQSPRSGQPARCKECRKMLGEGAPRFEIRERLTDITRSPGRGVFGPGN